ncbi:pyridoxal 5'-phosphate synthase glutaminase subunit PdxT [Methanobacterium alkalithermotolerans]|uniref:Pyridoxal 5'-phosphate synthase subunit PdxT n=1 Tax=Methanobacterium alkalithermotolerans TaxID=2731220 RepID=A0A8T8KAG4_9EURY|nr:pyridoxal 5'-phosphate synthase glutaminase subunit PdxT [Methanobacterium alkalithermotolerans]QUH24083.1 pyridoxal 5'-phosphate synthase glutaminase subunit PdxT [Methanobacterium alkalithermotolerans]RJS48982.1 MAG: pyridoxal 5'-phosphate synthase glutaminase subunit PdxT [Methanobacterium sp.]
MLTIGILDLQGNVSEHFEITTKALKNFENDSRVIKVRNSAEASCCDGIIISGGESTVIGKLLEKTGINNIIINEKIPVFGTCAGMVLSASKTDYEQPLLNLIDMEVKRNAFGRQKESFEKEIDILGYKFNGIFIRAPAVDQVGEDVHILSRLEDKIIGVKQGNNIAISFHPELTEDTRLHEYFIKEVLKCVE